MSGIDDRLSSLKAWKGEIPNFTGISAPYERPEDAEIHLDGTQRVDDLVDIIFSRIEE